MPSSPSVIVAIGVGVVAGALCALWVTVAGAQGTTVPGMAGPVGSVPGQAGPVAPVPGHAGPVTQVPGQSGPAPRASAPVRVRDQPPPAGAYAKLPRCDGGDCGDGGSPEAPDGGAPAEGAR